VRCVVNMPPRRSAEDVLPCSPLSEPEPETVVVEAVEAVALKEGGTPFRVVSARG
jgi:hypothetical protein